MQTINRFLQTTCRLGFKDVNDAWLKSGLPLYVDEVPVWVYACRFGYPKLFLAAIMQLEAMVQAPEDEENFGYIKSIRGFTPVTSAGVLINHVALIEKEEESYQKRLDKIVAILCRRKQHEHLLDDGELTKLIEADYSSYTEVNIALAENNWPSFICDVPIWKHCGNKGKWRFYVAFLHRTCSGFSVPPTSLLLKLQDQMQRRTKRVFGSFLIDHVPSPQEPGYNEFQQCLMGEYWQ
jgi:hypothetical protein